MAFIYIMATAWLNVGSEYQAHLIPCSLEDVAGDRMGLKSHLKIMKDV